MYTTTSNIPKFCDLPVYHVFVISLTLFLRAITLIWLLNETSGILCDNIMVMFTDSKTSQKVT